MKTSGYLAFIHSFISLLDKLEPEDPVCLALPPGDLHPVVRGEDGFPHGHDVPVPPPDPRHLRLLLQVHHRAVQERVRVNLHPAKVEFLMMDLPRDIRS